jgi:hypothetical protein
LNRDGLKNDIRLVKGKERDFMLLQQGIMPFVIAAVFMAVGLLIAWISNLKRDTAEAVTYERIGNFIATLGFAFGIAFSSQFRAPEYVHNGQAGKLPGLEVIVLMMCLYIPLMVLATSYTQYRKDRSNEMAAQKLRKDSIIGLIVFILFLIVAVFLKLYYEEVLS